MSASRVVWLCVVSLSSLAYAEPGEQSAPQTVEEAEARSAFEAGRDAYEHGLFAQALVQFERAYALSRLPQLLFNVGRAADSDGRAARAIAAYSSYLEAFPAANNVAFVKARLVKMRALELRETDPPRVPADALSVPTQHDDKHDDKRDVGQKVSAEAPLEAPRAPAPGERSSLKPAVITLGAAGLASTGLFVGYALAARRGYDRCDGPRFCSDPEFSDTYRKKVYLADGFGAAALALGSTASVLFFVQRAREKRTALPVDSSLARPSTRFDVRVALTPGHGKVVVHGRF